MNSTKKIICFAALLLTAAFIFAETLDKRYSYSVNNGILTIEYSGSDNPNLDINFFVPDPSAEWPWAWIARKDVVYKGKISVNIFDETWFAILRRNGSRPKLSKMFISVRHNEKDVMYMETQFIPNEKFLDSKDYSKRTFVPKNMKFTEESAHDAVAKMKMGANLSNHLDTWNNAHDEHFATFKGKDLPPILWETWWRENELTREHIKYLKSIGFTAVRLPVTWGEHLDSNDNILPGWMNRVQEVVDWCMEEDLYVILNSHHDSGGVEGNWIYANKESYEKYSGRFKKLWEQISERFKNYSEKLIFQSPNEMCEDVGKWDVPTKQAITYMEKWNQLFVDTVRASGGNNAVRNLSVSALNTKGTAVILAKTNLPKDTAKDHLIFEIHCYDPPLFCLDDIRYWAEKKDAILSFGKAKFNPKESFLPTYKFAKKNNIPVIIGEWGVLDKLFPDEVIKVPDEEKAKYAAVFVREALKNDFGLFIWGTQWYFGNTSINDAKAGWCHDYTPCPKYLKAIQDAVKNAK